MEASEEQEGPRKGVECGNGEPCRALFPTHAVFNPPPCDTVADRLFSRLWVVVLFFSGTVYVLVYMLVYFPKG